MSAISPSEKRLVKLPFLFSSQYSSQTIYSKLNLKKHIIMAEYSPLTLDLLNQDLTPPLLKMREFLKFLSQLKTMHQNFQFLIFFISMLFPFLKAHNLRFSTF